MGFYLVEDLEYIVVSDYLNRFYKAFRAFIYKILGWIQYDLKLSMNLTKC